MSDFEFKCPSCDGSLEASDDMQGTIVECPHCELRIRIPQAPEVRPSKPAAEQPPSHKHVVIKTRTPSAPPPNAPTRECPYCCGIVPAGAAKCRHCDADLPPPGKPKQSYGGVGRLGYWLAPFVFIFVTFAVSLIFGLFVAAACSGNPQAVQSISLGFSFVVGLLTLVLIIGLILSRLRNMGLSGWYALLFAVPLVNFGIGLACACFPEGYGDSKKLDVPAWILMVLYIGGFAGFVYAVMQMPGLAGVLKW